MRFAVTACAGLLAWGCNAGDKPGRPPRDLPPEGLYWGPGLPAAWARGVPADSLHPWLDTALARAARGGKLAAAALRYPRPGVIFPPEFIPPTFQWSDSSAADCWLLEFRPSAGPGFQALTPSAPLPPPVLDSGAIPDHFKMDIPDPNAYRHWTPDAQAWEAMKKASRESRAELRLTGFSRAGGAPLSRAAWTFMTARDSVGAPIFYRDVPLLPNRNKSGRIQPLEEKAVRKIRWSLRDVSRPQGRTVIPSLPTCANCHSFSEDGKFMGMDLDGPQNDKGTYGLTRLKPETDFARADVFSWNRDFKQQPRRKNTIGFLSRVSPDGGHVVTTVNEEVVIHNYLDPRYIQVFYPTRGILAYHARASRAIRRLPGADDTAYVHCDPAWTPDGSQIVFARARAKDPYVNGQTAPDYPNDPNETQIQYDLYRIPFRGGRGGQAVPIAGASANGMSNTFPKVTPDGRFVVFVKCRNGQLLRPDGELWMVPLEGGAARRMECNLPEMNSWHSFSPNGRWMVFSSKGFTHYTQLFLTHIGADGSDSPPVLIPDATAANRAANLPEFVNLPYDSLRAVTASALAPMQYLKDATLLMEQDRMAEAREKMRQALATDVDDPQFRSEVRVLLAWLQDSLPDRVRMTREAISLDPASTQAHLNLATLLDKQGLDREALAAYAAAGRTDPGNPWPAVAEARIYMHSVVPGLKDAGRAVRAAEAANRMAKYREPSILKTLARAYSETGRFREAEKTARQGLELARQQGLRGEAEELANEIPIYEADKSFSWALEMQGRR